MNCDEFEERAQLLMDARRAVSGDVLLNRHAARCARCHGRLRRYELLLQAVARLPATPMHRKPACVAFSVAPGSVAGRRSGVQAGWGGRRLPVLPAAAAALLVAAVSAPILFPWPQDGSSEGAFVILGTPSASSHAPATERSPHSGQMRVVPPVAHGELTAEPSPDTGHRDLINRVRGITRPITKTLRPMGETWLDMIYAVWETLPPQGDETPKQPAATIGPSSVDNLA